MVPVSDAFAYIDMQGSLVEQIINLLINKNCREPRLIDTTTNTFYAISFNFNIVHLLLFSARV